MTFDEKLFEWATPRQAEFLRAWKEHKTMRAAARAMGVSKNTLSDSMKGLQKRAAAQGYSPSHDLTHIIAEPFVARGHSTYYDRDGKPTQQWVKTRLDDQKHAEMLRAAVAAFSEDIPRLAPAEPAAAGAPELLNLYPLTDVHVGMLAWHKEGGADWDLKIAERTVAGCFEEMINRSPRAQTGFIAMMGDWFHYDGLLPVTPTSGHVVDADGRFAKMVQAGVRLARRVIDMALLKHEKLVLLVAEGNHDLASTTWMQTMFSALYENEPRITVVETPLPYYSHQHGRTALFFHHGHLKRPDGLAALFPAMFPAMWGSTDKRYAHAGHFHTLFEKEYPGLKVLQHPTLAARDAHAARGGWMSERQVSAITYHEGYGEVGRVTVTPEMLMQR